MKARNPKHTASGVIEMELEHPDFGLIPFAASANDTEPLGREMYARAMSGEFGAIAARDLIPNPRIQEITNALAALDARKVRPLAEGDAAFLSALNAQSAALRTELKSLPPLV